MIAHKLRQLGLTVREGQEVEADQALGEPPLTHPVTRAVLDRVTWAVRDGWLVTVAPPALRQVASVPLDAVDSAQGLAHRVHAGFRRMGAELQRRAAELKALGVPVTLDPESLELRGEVRTPAARYTIAADRLGNFRLVSAERDQQPLHVSSDATFELSEFRDVGALASYLGEMVGEAPAGAAAAAAAPALVRYDELVRAFGEGALVPPASPLELLVELEAGGQRYRFAAARVVGRTFRGLLASSRGKVWAERFDLDGFPGVVPLVSRVLGVPQDAVRVLRTQQE